MKKILFYYGINILVTFVLALLFGGVLGAIGGNKVILGLIITMGVQLSPMISAFICKKKYHDEINNNFTVKFNFWLIIAIIIPIILIVVSSVILSMIGIDYVKTGYTGTILLVAAITTIIGCTAEEIGWRGYLLPVLNKDNTMFLSSLYTGLLWGIWHFFKISNVGFGGYVLFVPSIVIFGIIMGYIYSKSERSMIDMILFHCFINFSTILTLYERECILFYIVLLIVELLLLAVIWLKDKDYFRVGKSR